MNGDVIVRDAREEDLAAICGIYADHVLHGSASFEEIPPDPAEIARRWRSIVEGGRPYLVAESAGSVVGYSYAAPYRARSAYRFSLENSVYIAQGQAGRGIGTALLAELIGRCEEGEWRQMVAVIGDSANLASIALHRKLGFREVGVLRNVGFKNGRWLDSVLMQRELSPGRSAAGL